MRRNAESGFTLVELMIVVAILGILAGLLLPRVADSMHRTKLAKAQTEMSAVTKAWMTQAPLLEAGMHFPTGSTVNVQATFPIQVTARQLEGFLQTEVPEMDPWGRPYDYRVNALPSACLMVRSAGSDGTLQEEYVVGTMIPPTERNFDLVSTDPRWLVNIDWWWRLILIPTPGPVDPDPGFTRN